MGNLGNNGFFFDWISFTLDFSKKNLENIENFFGEKVIEKSGILGYSNTFLTKESALVSFSPENPEKKISVQLSAESLGNLEDLQISSEMLINRILSFPGIKFTRLDLTKDDFSGILNLEKIEEKIKLGHIGSRLRNYQIFGHETNTKIESSKLGKNLPIGKTIYLGNFKNSNTLIRIYDKAKQIKTNGHWIRVEYQFRKEVADQFLNPNYLVDTETGELKKAGQKIITDSWKSRDPAKVALYYLQFLDPKYKNFKCKDFSVLEEVHKRYWPISDFWLTFLETDKKEPIGLPKYKNGLEGLNNWFERSMSGLTYLLQESDPKKFETMLDTIGKKAFQSNKHYVNLLNDKKSGGIEVV